MTADQAFTAKPDPVEALDQALRDAWNLICDRLDVVAGIPALSELVEEATLDDPAATAEIVVVNMLEEAMEYVCRYSPWYTRPAAAYGLAQAWDEERRRTVWQLSAQGLRLWEQVLTSLAAAFRKQAGLLRILLLVDELMEVRGEEESDCQAAACRCIPPRVILVPRQILANNPIRCDVCRATFRQIDRPR